MSVCTIPPEVCEEFSTFKDVAKYPVVTIVGGMPKDPQRKALRAGAQIACCTPGRLADLAEEESIDLSHVRSGGASDTEGEPKHIVCLEYSIRNDRDVKPSRLLYAAVWLEATRCLQCAGKPTREGKGVRAATTQAQHLASKEQAAKKKDQMKALKAKRARSAAQKTGAVPRAG